MLGKKKEIGSAIVAKSFDGSDIVERGFVDWASRNPGKYAAGALAASLGIGAGTGAGVSALASEKGKRAEGAKRGAKYGLIGGALGGVPGAALGGYWARSTKYKDAMRKAKAKAKTEKYAAKSK